MEEKTRLNQLEQIVADHEIMISQMTKQTNQLVIQTKIGWILALASIIVSGMAFYITVNLSLSIF
ncbi:MAG: hypothetical protein RJQ09_09940 [Cyclobacteriaceae bacterium]